MSVTVMMPPVALHRTHAGLVQIFVRPIRMLVVHTVVVVYVLDKPRMSSNVLVEQQPLVVIRGVFRYPCQCGVPVTYERLQVIPVNGDPTQINHAISNGLLLIRLIMDVYHA